MDLALSALRVGQLEEVVGVLELDLLSDVIVTCEDRFGGDRSCHTDETIVGRITDKNLFGGFEECTDGFEMFVLVEIVLGKI